MSAEIGRQILPSSDPSEECVHLTTGFLAILCVSATDCKNTANDDILGLQFLLSIWIWK